jgi:hypothetical protein
LVVAVEAGLDRRQIVAVAAGLLKDMPSDRFLALDLTLDHVDAGLEMIKLFLGYLRRHSTVSNCPDSNIAWVGCGARQKQLAASARSIM